MKRLIKNKFIRFYFCIVFVLIVYSCDEKDKIIYNQNGLSGHLEQIIECFVEDYDIQGKNIYAYEQYPTIEHKLPIFKKDINKYVYISMIPYTPSDIGSNRILYSAEMDDYTLFYAMDKNREMAISNNLIWKRIEFPEKEGTDTPKVLGIIDYKQTHFLYNIQENVIELSHFKSESCKGRLNDEYEW